MPNTFDWIGSNKEQEKEFRYCKICEEIHEVIKEQTTAIKEGSSQARVVWKCSKCRCIVSIQDGIKDEDEDKI